MYKNIKKQYANWKPIFKRKISGLEDNSFTCGYPPNSTKYKSKVKKLTNYVQYEYSDSTDMVQDM